MTERDFWFWLQGLVHGKNVQEIHNCKQVILKKLRNVTESFSTRMRFVRDFCLNKEDIDIHFMCDGQLESFIKYGCGQ